MTMGRVFVSIVCALLAFSAAPAQAMDCSTFDVVFANAERADGHPFAIPAERLPTIVADTQAVTGDNYGEVTRGFLLFLPDVLIVGFEAHGCLYTPIIIQRPNAGARASA